MKGKNQDCEAFVRGYTLMVEPLQKEKGKKKKEIGLFGQAWLPSPTDMQVKSPVVCQESQEGLEFCKG